MKRPPAWCRAATTGRGFLSARCLLAGACCLLLLTGCPGPDSDSDDSSGRLAMVGTLRLAVVDDPALARAIERQRAEWQGQTGADFEVEELTLEQLADAGRIPADAIICPSHQLGALAAKDWLVPVPESLRKADRGQWPEIFSLLRTREAVWGSQVLGVPFGSPVFVCYYRADLLEKLDRRPPETWKEYQKLAELLANRQKLGEAAPPDESAWHGAIEPLGPGWAGQVLLARAAAYATHPENYSTLFQVDTMTPLVDGPAFVRALEELVAVAADGPAEQLSYDPAAVRKAFWEGRCGLALAWPSAAGSDSMTASEGLRVGFAEMPGSAAVYDFVDQAWERRGKDRDPHVPLLGIAGRLGTVTRRSKWPEATCQLLLWLTDDERCVDVCTASPATTLFRPSHLETAAAWAEPPVRPAEAGEYAALTQTTLTRQQRLFAVRIPGRSEYLDALDKAVHRAVRGEQKPKDALAAAAAQWEEITDRLGRQHQSEAYYRSLGLD